LPTARAHTLGTGSTGSVLREAHSVINILQPTSGADELAAVGDVFVSMQLVGVRERTDGRER